MRNSDATCIASGISGLELMYRAGEAIFNAHAWKGKTAIVCGKGNNGGDGYVLALLLKENNLSVDVIAVEDNRSPDADFYYKKCQNEQINIVLFDETIDFSQYDTIVDCLFGTGFKGVPNQKYQDVINAINSVKKYVISVDINSGLCGDNGLGDVFVKSDLTVSIGTLKSGNYLGKAKDATKKILNYDIGIPIIGKEYKLVESKDFVEYFSERENYSHKGKYGYVAILGGCKEYSGAVKLANMSLCALKIGAGVSKLIIPNSIYESVSPYVLESTLFAMPDNNGVMKFKPKLIDKALRGVKSLAIGMGWGNGKNNRKILEYVLNNFAIPVVIDADGINVLAKDLSILKSTKAKVILTPHLKEMSRLTEKSITEIENNPIEICEEFAQKYEVNLLLKGPTSIVTNGFDTYLINKGCAGMATAGSGDVLSGIIVGILGSNYKNIALSVAYATFINGLSGEFAQKQETDISMTASSTVTYIKDAIIYCREKNK
ncbi:MAG: NAD(P)H-hydrate dehydratase [Clostridia bacterium]|nr:NAD(P)H-hydrate dehydratase [Clostridia bacterium]